MYAIEYADSKLNRYGILSLSFFSLFIFMIILMWKKYENKTKKRDDKKKKN